MNRYLIAVFLVLVSAIAARAQGPAAEPERINGRAMALDGDTLQIGDRRIRLWGIDTAEMKDRPAGPLARAALDDLIAGWTVACEVRDTDRYKRAVAICGTPETPDLSIALLKAGQATAYRTFTQGWPEAVAYDDAERTARMASVGQWMGNGENTDKDNFDIIQTFTVPVAILIALITYIFNKTLQARQHRHDRQMEKDRIWQRRSAVAGLIAADLRLIGEAYSTTAFFLAKQAAAYSAYEYLDPFGAAAHEIGKPEVGTLFWPQLGTSCLDADPEIVMIAQPIFAQVQNISLYNIPNREIFAGTTVFYYRSYAEKFSIISDLCFRAYEIISHYIECGEINRKYYPQSRDYIYPVPTHIEIVRFIEANKVQEVMVNTIKFAEIRDQD